MNNRAAACIAVGAAFAFGFVGSARAEERKRHTPFSYDFNIGGMAPLGKTGDSYSPSFLIGGGATAPIGRWVSLDWATLDFGFGTAGPSRTFGVSDGSTRRSKNYQVMFTSGGRVNLPLGKSAALGLGGGYGAVFQNEYVPGRTSYSGLTRVTEQIDCRDCSRNSFQGPYMMVRLFARTDRFTGGGVTAKYFITRDADRPASSPFRLPPQRWLTVGVTFSFGI